MSSISQGFEKLIKFQSEEGMSPVLKVHLDSHGHCQHSGSHQKRAQALSFNAAN